VVLVAARVSPGRVQLVFSVNGRGEVEVVDARDLVTV
jgi:hypothetical protein